MPNGNKTPTADRPVWNVYLLRCSDNSLYCGVTIDMARRLRTHRKGNGSKYVRSRLPIKSWLFVYGFTKSDALSHEARIKKMPKHEKPLELGRLSKDKRYGGSI